MLAPKRTKYRKQQRGRMKGKATRNVEISFGDFGLMALEQAWITNRQIEACAHRHHPPREARREGLDPDLPRQALHQEAAPRRAWARARAPPSTGSRP